MAAGTRIPTKWRRLALGGAHEIPCFLQVNKVLSLSEEVTRPASPPACLSFSRVGSKPGERNDGWTLLLRQGCENKYWFHATSSDLPLVLVIKALVLSYG